MPLTVLYVILTIYKKSDTSITVIYNAMPLTVLYVILTKYKKSDMSISDISRYASDCTVCNTYNIQEE